MTSFPMSRPEKASCTYVILLDERHHSSGLLGKHEKVNELQWENCSGIYLCVLRKKKNKKS